MKALLVASESVPFVKTGGLADVVGALPGALAKEGIETRILLPAYPDLRRHVAERSGHPIGILPERRGSLFEIRLNGLDLLLLDAPELFDRPGNPYLGPDGIDWPDNHLRFAALCRAAIAAANGDMPGYRPDILHVHDWQAGLVPLLLRTIKNRPPCVTTIHNIAFQGLFEPSAIGETGLPEPDFNRDGYEYYGKVSFLKAGLVYADAITTVSPTYAKELLTPEFGMGMEGVLRSRRNEITGILNGIDLDAWDPSSDAHIEEKYEIGRMRGKKRNKKVLETRFGLEPDGTAPLFCVISRLTVQKGLDLLLENLPALVEKGGRLVVLGTGEPALEREFLAATRRFPGRVSVVLGYDEPLSHQMQAGSDAIIVPSRFEPCGLTQLYGLRYGTIPVVARTGGLADTVIDANHAALTSGAATGFVFDPASATGLADAISRMFAVYENKPLWRGMVRLAMRQKVGWETSAAAYASLYRRLLSI